MALIREKKKGIIENFKIHSTDTGSPSVQIALLTERINLLTEHLKGSKKDFDSRRGLLKLIGRRRKLLNYLKKYNLDKYKEIIDKLNLRK